jgi:hypothetical protein
MFYVFTQAFCGMTVPHGKYETRCDAQCQAADRLGGRERMRSHTAQPVPMGDSGRRHIRCALLRSSQGKQVSTDGSVNQVASCN